MARGRGFSTRGRQAHAAAGPLAARHQFGARLQPRAPAAHPALDHAAGHHHASVVSARRHVCHARQARRHHALVVAVAAPARHGAAAPAGARVLQAGRHLDDAAQPGGHGHLPLGVCIAGGRRLRSTTAQHSAPRLAGAPHCQARAGRDRRTLLPKHTTVPPLLTTHVWKPPAATCTTPVSPAGGAFWPKPPSPAGRAEWEPAGGSGLRAVGLGQSHRRARQRTRRAAQGTGSPQHRTVVSCSRAHVW